VSILVWPRGFEEDSEIRQKEDGEMTDWKSKAFPGRTRLLQLVTIPLALAISVPCVAAETRPGRSSEIAKYEVALNGGVAVLGRAYESGDWNALTRLLHSVISETRAKLSVSASGTLEPIDRDTVSRLGNGIPVSVAFINEVALPDPVVTRILYDEMEIDPFPHVLNGSTTFYELFLSDQDDALLATTFQVTRQESPLLLALPKLLGKVDTALWKGVFKPEGVVTAARVNVSASLRRLEVPRRSTIEIKDFAKPQPKKERVVKGNTTYVNEPPTYATFGILTGGIVDRGLEERVKVNKDVLQADPATGVLSLFIINLHPWGYSARAVKSSAAERWRLFAGTVITPDFGLAAGVGVQLIRGLALNGGYAFLLSDTLRNKDKIGGAPSNLKRPTKRGISGVLFVGFSYSFE
jgi:hypothetical protein